MKEFIKNKTVTYNLMSFTGFKALILFSLLSEAPRSYEEIKSYFLNHPYLKEKISLDTLRVYLTSMKRVGCVVKRERINGVSKYSIVSNPFSLEVTEEQIKTLVKLYKIVVKSIDIRELYSIEHFIMKLRKSIKNPETLDYFNKYSLLRGVDLDLLQNLISAVDKNEQIMLEYNSPTSGIKDVELITKKFEIKNDKIYLRGITLEYKPSGAFLLNRILKIKTVKIVPEKIDLKPMVVGVEYYGDLKGLNLQDGMKIISQEDGKALLELTSTNEFLLRQCILEMVDNARIVYPESYKKQFVQNLKEIESGYSDD
ncbi:MAG: hypothetical protein LKG27_00965 [Clostridiaceae bacterium]|jgi:hypothetical protein|nr:hypothetical protein [Clostridiaceae bacterium]